MTLTPYEDGPTSLATVQDQAVHRLGEWAQSAQAAHQVAEHLSQSAFVPVQFRGKPMELTAAILSGLELGLSPMASMRAFDIIQGQAAARAITLRAVVQAHGHEMVLGESTATRCRMKGRRRGSSEWQAVTWTLDRARDLGLTSRDGWKKQPTAMLLARATSELARLIAADAILGLPYSAEELADGGTVEAAAQAEAVAPTQTGSRRMSRRKPEPSPEPEPDPDEPRESPLLDTTSPLAKAMFAALNDLGITTRDARLAYVSDVLGRTVESSAELTEDDARAVLARADVDKADHEAMDRPHYSSHAPEVADPDRPHHSSHKEKP